MRSPSGRVAMLGATFLLVLGATGCATKKWVRTKVVQPLEAKIHGVDQKTAELDTRVTGLDHKTEQGISDAQSKADAANQAAEKADQGAQKAQQAADKGLAQVAQVQQDVNNLDTYQPAKTETVFFRSGRSDLTDEEKEKLDSLAQSLSSIKHYAIDVEGFTDQTGPKAYNLELSRRRADTVVRYLTASAHVPLVKIHALGYGEDAPVGDNETSAGRQQNRRVEVKIMAPQVGQQISQTQASTTSSAQ